MAAPEPLNPTRKDLEQMAPNKRTARQLELLFVKVQELEERLAAAEALIEFYHP